MRTIDVLWYTGGTNDGSYVTDVNNLATAAPGAPGGNTWNVTIWSGGAMPTGAFNVLVVASPQGGWSPYPDYSGLTAAGLTFNPATTRVMLTGQDADWHYMNYPGPASFDGPGGFLLDGINWAGSGSGMGLVQLGFDTGDCVINCEPSMTTGGGYTVSGLGGTQNVIIPAAQAGFPINTGLTSAGLSNWSTSAHNSYFVTNTGLWDGINLDGSVSSDPCTGPSCDYVTIVSAASAGGTITPTPEPASLLLFGSAAALAAGLIRRKKRA